LPLDWVNTCNEVFAHLAKEDVLDGFFVFTVTFRPGVVQGYFPPLSGFRLLGLDVGTNAGNRNTGVGTETGTP
jgi:hypothetical protein